MHYAIIAAGLGSRIAGIGPKPLVEVGGESLVGRQLRILCARADARSITVVTNADTPEVAAHIRRLELPLRPQVIEARTAGALESLELAAGGRECIALTVDTVFSAERFAPFTLRGADGACRMALTRFIDDEKPLYVDVDPATGLITGFGPQAGSPWVSAGIYGLGAEALEVMARCRAEGMTDLSAFQQRLVDAGVRLRAFDLGTAVDLDRPADLETARKLIALESCRH